MTNNQPAMKKPLLFSACILATTFTFAQWEPDVRLTNNTAISQAAFANTWGIAYDGDTLHVVWYDSRDGNYEIYYKMSPDGGDTWGPDIRLTFSTGDSWSPGIAVSGQVLHVSWEDARNGPREIYYKRSLDGGLTWESDVRMTYANINAFLVSVAANGTYVHLTWQDERDGNDEVYYKRSVDGGATWDSDVRLSNDPEYSGLPSVAVSGSVVHIAWEENRNGNGEIYYIRSVDNGTNWGPETRLTTTILESWDPAIAVSGLTVHCTYMEDVMGGDYEIFYIRSVNSGLTWETPVRLSYNTASSIYPNIASLGQDVHVVWRDQRDGQPEIYYNKSANGGTTWALVETRLTNSAGISEYPTVCATPAATHVVWHDNRVGNYEIFYKRYLNSLSASVYYERLFYLCKAWGHAKYHHTGIAAGNINWDDELFKAIQGAKNLSDQVYNDSLQMILENAGQMAMPSDTLPYIPDTLNYNDYSWIQDDIFTDEVRSLLDTILTRFRPQSNVYVNCAGLSVNVEMDQQYYQESAYPSEEKRLLALFRYWNIIHYFFPSKNLMDQDWDSTLEEFIPKVDAATDSVSFMLCFKELTTRINDSHGYLFGSTSYYNWRGSYYPPFLADYVENEMVVTKVLDGNPGISVGDVIKSIDGVDIYYQRDSLRKYAHGSNDPVIERELNYLIMYGPDGISQVVLDDGIGLDTVSFSRNGTNFNELMWVDNSPMWTDTIMNGQCHYGIVNMYNLESSWVGDMFYALWETDAIIFDIRRGAYSTIENIVNYIYSNPIEIAKYLVPKCTYPGTYYWDNDYIGGGIPEPYTGNIIILFNEGTQSHGEWTCMGFEPFPGLIKIGSQTAGADGNVSTVYVPGQISTWFTGLGINYPDYTQTQRIGIVPDYEVHPTIAGIRAGIDEVMAFALDCTLLDAKEIASHEDFRLYPNPFNEKLNYELPGIEDSQMILFEIIDIYGRTVAKLHKDTRQGELDFPDVATGAYIIKITTNQEVLTKIVIRN
jgi:carboxyl-terminal processing protease